VADVYHARGPVDLGTLLKELQAEYGPDFMEERIQILPIVSPDLPPISGDPRRLKTAFRILMLTSRTSLHPSGGTVFLRAWEDDGNVFCTVSDDGPGMEEAQVEELMALEPLFPEDAEASGPESFGAVRLVVEDLGGRLHVESRPQLWTRFTVMIPACPAQGTVPGTVQDSLPPAVEVRAREPGALEVLVVDDNESIRAILRRFLEKRGHQVTEAEDGDMALELVRGQEFDKLMVDIYMPGLTGTEFYDGLDTVAPTMKDRTIFMTGGLQDSTVEEYVEATGRPSIEKPFDLSEMVRTLES
jgi:two-component system cell cycle sensor histidine kinase/response regulator CckA